MNGDVFDDPFRSAGAVSFGNFQESQAGPGQVPFLAHGGPSPVDAGTGQLPEGVQPKGIAHQHHNSVARRGGRFAVAADRQILRLFQLRLDLSQVLQHSRAGRLAGWSSRQGSWHRKNLAGSVPFGGVPVAAILTGSRMAVVVWPLTSRDWRQLEPPGHGRSFAARWPSGRPACWVGTAGRCRNLFGRRAFGCRSDASRAQQCPNQLVLPHGMPTADAALSGHLGQIFLCVRLERCWGHQGTYLRSGPAQRNLGGLRGGKSWCVSVIHDRNKRSKTLAATP